MSKILVVDDDAVDRELAERCLRKIDGAGIHFANDGQQALDAIPECKPDVILTDLRMPGMDGLTLVRAIESEWPELPVVLMTSQGSEQIAVSALKAGAANYVPKQVLKEELCDTIQQILDAAAGRQTRQRILHSLRTCQSEFELENDPELVYPLSGFCEDNLVRLGFGSAADRMQVGMAIMEAVSNAMIHGNLEVSSDLRQESKAKYTARIDERRGEEPYGDRRVQFRAEESSERVKYTVTDEGPGFDPRILPDPTSAANLLAVSGRGVMLMRTFMDEVRYNEKGNEVVMIKEPTPDPGANGQL